MTRRAPVVLRVRTLAGIAVAAVSASSLHCGGRADDPPNDPPNPAYTLRGFIDAYTEASCAREDRCASTLGRLHASHAVCVARPRSEADYGRYYFGIDYYADLDADYVPPTPDDATACLDALAQDDCASSAASIEAACAPAFQPRTPKAEGEGCAFGSGRAARMCGRGLACTSLDSGPCWACTVVKWHDEACSTYRDCGGVRCHAGRCRPGDARLGEACANSKECIGNLECSRGGVCTALAGVGAECPGPNNCQIGLGCDPVTGAGRGTCRPLGLTGETCWRNPVSPQMACHEWCRFPTPDAAVGTCGVAPADGVEHTPCSNFRDNTTLDCPRGLFQSANPSYTLSDRPACECLAPRAVGAPCKGFERCAGSDSEARYRCLVDAGPEYYGTGICGRGAPVGAPCAYSSGCDSSFCDATTSTCQPPRQPQPSATTPVCK